MESGFKASVDAERFSYLVTLYGLRQTMLSDDQMNDDGLFLFIYFSTGGNEECLNGVLQKAEPEAGVPVHYLLLDPGAEVRDKSRDAEREGEQVQGCF